MATSIQSQRQLSAQDTHLSSRVATEDQKAESLPSRIYKAAKSIFTSPTFWVGFLGVSLLALTCLYIATAVSPAIILTSSIVDIATVASIAIANKKQIKYEISLANTILFNKLNKTRWPWHTKLDDDIYLGAIPLKSRGHLEEIKKLGSKKGIAILSMVEPFEMQKNTIFSSPVSVDDWKRAGISQLSIPSVDFEAPSIQDLQRAVDFIQEQIKAGKKVYIHCKAGRGRSASAAAAYYIVKNKWSVKRAIAFIKEKRPFVSLDKQSKIDRLCEYEEYHKLHAQKSFVSRAIDHLPRVC